MNHLFIQVMIERYVKIWPLAQLDLYPSVRFHLQDPRSNSSNKLQKTRHRRKRRNALRWPLWPRRRRQLRGEPERPQLQLRPRQRVERSVGVLSISIMMMSEEETHPTSHHLVSPRWLPSRGKIVILPPPEKLHLIRLVSCSSCFIYPFLYSSWKCSRKWFISWRVCLYKISKTELLLPKRIVFETWPSIGPISQRLDV